jgi:hypothetical protein
MKVLCLFALLFLLFNCSPPSVTYKRTINNNSSYDIWLINPDTVANCVGGLVLITIQDSILVPSNTSRTFESSEERNASVNDYAGCPVLCLDTINTRISDHDSLNLIAPLESTNSNWQYTVLNPGESGSCECQLSITDADIN